MPPLEPFEAPRTGPRSPRLVIVCGLPGAGKTTHAKQIEEQLPAIRFCADDWMDTIGINLWNGEVRDRIEQLQWNLAQQVLTLGGNVVIEWGSWGRSERDLLRTTARKLGAAVELHFLDVPLKVLFDRVRNRKMETPPITFEDLQRWDRIFERPTSEEMELFDPPWSESPR